MPLCSKIWAKLPWYFVVLPCNIKSGWPSGLRRCVQVAVHFCGRGFESHFWQIFFLDKTDLTIGNDTFFLNQYTDSRVAQWKRAGPITQRSVDRNYALLSSFSSFLRENNWYVMNPKKIAWFFPNSRMQDSTLSFQNDENYYFFLQIKICSRLSSTHLTFHVIL